MPSNQDYLNRLRAVECHDSTYAPNSNPLIFSRARGSLIWDVEGREYIDLCAGFGALPLGHASQPLLDVTSSFSSAQPPIEHGMGDVYPSEEKILFLETLRSMLPKAYSKGALALGGGQAVEIALKTAMLATKKSGFIVFEEGYHGLDLGVLPLTAREDFKMPFKNWFSDGRVVRLPYGCSQEELEKGVKNLGHCGLAAVVAEPIQGRAGVRLPPKGWLETVATFAHANSALLVLDEIFTGFGRIGCVTAAEFMDADILCFGKAIGGGFPVSACFAKEYVMDAWPKSQGEAIHTGTFFGHPFTAAVGRRTLEQILKLKLAGRAVELGEQVMNWLRTHIGDHPNVNDIRGQGLMIGIEFNEPGFAAKLMDRLRGEGVIVLPSGATGSVLSITPALNIHKELIEEGLIRLAKCL